MIIGENMKKLGVILITVLSLTLISFGADLDSITVEKDTGNQHTTDSEPHYLIKEYSTETDAAGNEYTVIESEESKTEKDLQEELEQKLQEVNRLEYIIGEIDSLEGIK